MEAVTIPQSLIFVVAIIGIVVQFLREFAALDKFKRFIPYVSIVCGIVYSFFTVGYPDCVMIGIAIGLMASGGYDAVHSFSDSKKFDLIVPGNPSNINTGMTAKTANPQTGALPPLILLCSLLFLTGCPHPLFTQEQRLNLQQAEIVVTELDARCQAGDAQACKDGLHQAAITLQQLTAAP